jgi:hypothetical protein
MNSEKHRDDGDAGKTNQRSLIGALLAICGRPVMLHPNARAVRARARSLTPLSRPGSAAGPRFFFLPVLAAP